MPKYREVPDETPHMPPGVPYIVGNEAAERFSYYGMRAILVTFMTQHLLNAAGQPDAMTNEQAKVWFHLFLSAAYFFPVLGAIISDVWLGKYPTIIALSIVYCLGHFALAVDVTRLGLLVGLTLIAVGAGGIKPCVSAHVGDQFGKTNQHLLEQVFNWFYLAINLGAAISTLATPWLLVHYGPHVAFSVPGVLMLIATIVFWMGRWKFVHVPPNPQLLVDFFAPQTLFAVLRLSGIYAFYAVFWALYDQTGGAWVLQAEKMDRVWMKTEWLPAQVQTINPVLVLVFIPLFSLVVYPFVDRFLFVLSPLRKIGIGLFLTAISFSLPALIETWIDAGHRPNISWQLLAFVLITAAEVLISPTGLEFSYTQAPKGLKSFVMSLFLLAVSVGNALASAVNYAIQNPDGTSRLSGASYYWFFAGLMFAAACVFPIVAWFYRGPPDASGGRDSSRAGH